MKAAIFSMIMFSCALVSAQGDSLSSNVEQTPWTFAGAQKNLKFSPFDLISMNPTLGADLEFFVSDSLSFQGGFGLQIPGSRLGGDFEVNPARVLLGYKFRAESRFFIMKKRSRYISTELGFRHQIIKDNIGIGMEPSTIIDEFGFETQAYAYFINTDMVFHKFTANAAFKFGIQKMIASRFILDMYVGVNVRKSLTRTWSDIPEGGTIPRNNGFFNFQLGDRVTSQLITPMVGLKIGFVLKNKPTIQSLNE